MTNYLEILDALVKHSNNRSTALKLSTVLKLTLNTKSDLEGVFIKLELQRDDLVDMMEEGVISHVNYTIETIDTVVNRLALNILTGFILRKSQYFADKESGKIIS